MHHPSHDYDRHAGERRPGDGSPGRSYAPAYIATAVRAPVVEGKWSTGLCHCCDDPENCLVTCFCPCITFGQISEIITEGSSSCAVNGALYGVLALTGFACLFSCFYRSKLRAEYDLDENPCGDFLVHFCCEACSLCQEYRELKNRGFDMGIGWEANMDRKKRGVTVAPVAQQGMMR